MMVIRINLAILVVVSFCPGFNVMGKQIEMEKQIHMGQQISTGKQINTRVEIQSYQVNCEISAGQDVNSILKVLIHSGIIIQDRKFNENDYDEIKNILNFFCIKGNSKVTMSINHFIKLMKLFIPRSYSGITINELAYIIEIFNPDVDDSAESTITVNQLLTLLEIFNPQMDDNDDDHISTTQLFMLLRYFNSNVDESEYGTLTVYQLFELLNFFYPTQDDCDGDFLDINQFIQLFEIIRQKVEFTKSEWVNIDEFIYVLISIIQKDEYVPEPEPEPHPDPVDMGKLNAKIVIKQSPQLPAPIPEPPKHKTKCKLGLLSRFRMLIGRFSKWKSFFSCCRPGLLRNICCCREYDIGSQVLSTDYDYETEYSISYDECYDQKQFY